MTDREKAIRRDIRAFLMVATMDELRRELQISLDKGDAFRAACIRELIEES